VTDGCKTFLQSFNADSKISSVLAPLLTATARFNPSSGQQSIKADVTWALNELCDPKAAFKASDIQTTVTNYYSACQSDMVSGNQPDLTRTFELLYALPPLRNAVCSKDATGAYCLSSAKKNGGHADTQAPTNQVNLQSWSSSHIHYLFINADETPEQLCTACTKQVLTAYVSYENVLPFPMGMSSSVLLKDQKALWSAITAKCPADFTQGILSAANAVPVDISNVAAQNGASSVVLSTTGLVGALVALTAALA
jgi:hypothetical protein